VSTQAEQGHVRHRGLTDRLCHELVMEDIQVCSLGCALPGQRHASIADLIPVCCQALIHFQWSCQPSVSLSCIACMSHTSLGHRLSQAERHCSSKDRMHTSAAMQRQVSHTCGCFLVSTDKAIGSEGMQVVQLCTGHQSRFSWRSTMH